MIDQVLSDQLTKQLIQDMNCSIALNKGFVSALNYEIRGQARRKHFVSGAAIGTKKTAGGLGGAVSPPAGPGQSPGGGPGGEAPGSSVNVGILKP